jgi:hypothetical protein
MPLGPAVSDDGRAQAKTRSYTQMECRLTTRGRVPAVPGLPDRSATSERGDRHGLDVGDADDIVSCRRSVAR